MEPKISISAERFLNLIRSSKQGKLKIYLGMAAGVGKTYRMLLEAKELLNNKVDVVIGFIETHGRKETEKLLEGLPALKRKEIFYKGKMLEEMDVNSILLQKPEIVLVDELAHTNIPGSKNEKRWQDVNQLIEAGINVITTVNIQHIESINEQVEKITGIKVTERVPDSIIHSADEVVNVDITTDELIIRLKEGKIYDKSRINIALNNFFTEEKLLLLRELALRESTQQVERKIAKEIPIDSRPRLNALMACISTNSINAVNIIRRASRIATLYKSSWYVVYVQTPKDSLTKINSEYQRKLINNFKLAVELGADVIKLTSANVAEALVNFAQEKEVGLIIFGKPHLTFFSKFFRRSLFREILKKTEYLTIDLIMVSNHEKT